MDWVKIKVAHVEDSTLTDAEVGQLVRYQAKVAKFQRPLSEKEFKTTFSKEKLEKIVKFLQENEQISLEFIVEKVLEDVEKTLKNSKKNTDKVRQYRDHLRLKRQSEHIDVPRVQNQNVTNIDKIREDKRRAAPPNPPEEYSALFLENLNTEKKQEHSQASVLELENSQIEKLARKIVDCRISNGQKIENPEGLTRFLIKSAKKNNSEYVYWLGEMAAYDRKSIKKMAQKNIEDGMEREAISRKIEAEKSKKFRDLAIAKFNEMGEIEKSRLQKKAEGEIRSQMGGMGRNVKFMGDFLNNKIAEIMKNEGIISEEAA